MSFLCSPVNPSGHVIDKELLLRAADICEKSGIRMVLDECFTEFLDVPEKYSMIDETEKYRQLFILRAFTKIYAMPGLRLGYGISSDHEPAGTDGTDAAALECVSPCTGGGNCRSG